jgi:hypothetical protein
LISSFASALAALQFRRQENTQTYGSMESQEARNPRPLQECKRGFVEEFRVSCCEGQPCGAFSTLLLQALLFPSCAAAALTPSVLCIFVFCAIFIHPCKQTNMSGNELLKLQASCSLAGFVSVPSAHACVCFHLAVFGLQFLRRVCFLFCFRQSNSVSPKDCMKCF